MRIAVDVSVSNVDIGRLTREGDIVVVVAKDREEDASWVSRALELGAEAIISKDLDVPNLLDQWGIEGVLWFEKIWAYRDWKDKRGKSG